MKKHNIFAAAVLSALLAAVSGCKSVPKSAVRVDPLLLLDNESSFYLRIPSSADEKLISRVVQGAVKGISESDARLISSRIDVVYAGLNKKRTKTDYQIAASCDFPKAAVSKAFSRKNGWTKDSLLLNDGDGNPVEYGIYSDRRILASFPGQMTACAGRNVPSMVETYHNAYYNLSPSASVLDENIYSWLCFDSENPDGKIKYYASKPQSFLTMLTGAVLNFNLVYVRGSIESDPKRDDQFVMDFEFEFRDKKFVPVARGSLAVAFGLTDSDVYLETPTHLVVSNIKISKEQLYNILVL